jgi:hypothetical protein
MKNDVMSVQILLLGCVVYLEDNDLHLLHNNHNIVKNKVASRCRAHRFSINRPTKRGKENSRSDGHCQCEKEMKTICWRVNKYLI